MPQPLTVLQDRIGALGKTEEEKRLLLIGLQLFLESIEGLHFDQNLLANQPPEYFAVPRSLVMVLLWAKRAIDDPDINTDGKIEAVDDVHNAIWLQILLSIGGGAFL